MASDVAEQKLSDAQVRAYLRANPDFFQANDDLLSALNLPARPTGEGIADFQKFLVERLRKEGEELKAEQGDLIANARANMNTQNRVHSAVLFLLDARNFEQFITTMTNDLAVLLDVDTVVLAVESADITLPGVNQPGIRIVPTGTADLWLGAKTVRLDTGISGDPTLLGPAADLVQSQAIIRLDVDPRMPVGMLILGSRAPEMFDPGQGTELAQFLGRVVERQLRHWLQV